MPDLWPEDTDFALWELDVLDRACPVCGRRRSICGHRYRRLHTLEGPLPLIGKLNHCPDRDCPGHARTRSPELEATIAPPHGAIGWDVFCGIGHRRCSRHRAVPHIRSELQDTYAIKLWDDAIAKDIPRYQVMLAARQRDPEARRRAYESVDELVLSIDGLQAEKGHETLDVVRELTRKRVWFAEALISATAAEVPRLIATAEEWARRWDKEVVLGISDKQDAFVAGIAAEFPGVPHRYCDNHFRRDVAKPVSEADSHAKVQMRKEVRGLRGIERSVLSRRRGTPPVSSSEPIVTEGAVPSQPPSAPNDPAGDVVLDSGTAVRGILNNDQGGPLHPPGFQMADALDEARESIPRGLDAEKGGSPNSHSAAGPTASPGGWGRSRPSQRRSETTSRTSRK